MKIEIDASDYSFFGKVITFTFVFIIAIAAMLAMVSFWGLLATWVLGFWIDISFLWAGFAIGVAITFVLGALKGD